MSKRLFSLILVLCMACFLLPVNAHAAEIIGSGDCNGSVTWQVTSDGVLTISGEGGISTASSYGWNQYAADITDVTIKDGITNIPADAFSALVNLKTAAIGSTVTEIGEEAFSECTKLTTITIPAAVTRIGNYAFWNCTSLSSVKFAEGSALNSLGIGVFQESGISSVTFPETLTHLSEYTFYNCQKLTSAVLHEGLQTIGRYAYQDCSNLTAVTLPSTLTDIDYGVFSGCSKIERLKVHSSTVELAEHFSAHPTLNNVVFAEGVTRIPAGAFEGCAKLATLTLPKTVQTIESNAFSGCSALANLTWPASLVTIGDNAFSGTGLTSVTLPNTVTDIGTAFSGCQKLTSIDCGTGLKSLDDKAFSGNAKLATVKLNNVEKIGTEAFRNCTALTTLALPAKLTTIGDLAFSGTGLTNVTLPDTVTSIGTAYNGCANLTTIDCGVGLKALADEAFTGSAKLTSIKLHNVETIGNETFKDCVLLASIDLTNVKSVGYYAFQNCGKLSLVTWGEKLTTLGHSAFDNCDALSSVTIPVSLTVINSYTFSGCDRLETVVIPETVTEISNGAFRDCPILTSVYVMGKDTAFGRYVFENSVNATVFGWTGSTSEAAAAEEGLRFVPLHDATHTYDTGKITQEATCAKEGILTYSCKNCDKVVTFTQKKLDHDFDSGAVTKKPTCTEPGVMTYTCKNCDAFYTEEIEMLPHDYEYLVCTGCGKGKVARIKGNNRCETAFEVADALKETLGVNKFDAIILASGNNFADALAGSYLASVKGAPILLYRAGFEDENLDYIQKNLAADGTVYILGGTAAVSKQMEDMLDDAKISVNRLWGDDRFDTNLRILDVAGTSGKEILIVTAWDFADSLSASATGLPILMVNSSSNKLHEGQIEFLKDNKASTFTIIGGTSAVSADLEKAIEDIIGKSVERVYGSSREQTSAKVADKYFKNPMLVVVAYSRNFPDGLCGGPLANAMGAPLLLANTGAEKAASDYIASKKLDKGIALGGTSAISDGTVRICFGLDDGYVIDII